MTFSVYETVLNNNFMAQIVCLLFAIVIWAFMAYTKPRKTPLFDMNKSGIVCSVILIIEQLFIPVVVMSLGYERMIISKLYFLLFLCGYCSVVDMIFVYIYRLAHKKDSSEKPRRIAVSIFNSLYLIFMLYAISRPDLMVIDGKNLYFSDWGYFYLYFGILASWMCCATIIVNRKYISRKIIYYAQYFVLFDMVILLLQIMFKEVIFSAITYVMPMVICYVLFHSNPMEENSGCRNEFSFFNEYQRLTRKKKNFVVINLYFPIFKKEEIHDITIFHEVLARVCRKIENMDKSITIYYKNRYTYNIVMAGVDDKRLNEIVDKISDMFSKAIKIEYSKVVNTMKLLAIRSNEVITSGEQFNNFIKFISGKVFADNTVNETYIVSQKDYDEFQKFLEIVDVLFDIRNTGDLDDDRIVCFAQPIYEISSGKYKSAEALMRMKINDKIIYPDSFIPIAEQNGMIHLLTCVMVNKVCKAVKNLSEEYEFEAITINSSTSEFDDLHFNSEILDIIKKNGIEPEKIRIEITESNMVNSYSNILYNMEKMKEQGIYCYLDDFGTGYSNLERIFKCPFKTIKFDKSVFYKSMEDSAMDEVMASMVDAFKKKGFNVLVEGIEDEIQRNRCIDRGFEYIQGYFYSKPLDICRLSEFFEKKEKV